ncbi:[formate-C-acetyltransferase]-activating enzyme [Dongshaea marina]|uniref:[formate-C-acetyltransferase]-activating enzyme n=1 Tax=Dongshaea marina TaxID=2047966 RepID=UPI0019025214|nr:[formate-C-acetyltransferase]-activating enzyme [Dongshaea marina]
MNCENLTAREQRVLIGRIFNIQRYSLHDGTGIRTLVFFKGCPLRCPWCANPESRSNRIQYVRKPQKCIHCDECAMDSQECPSGAWEQVGTEMTVEDVMAEIAKDDIFFDASNGGVTLSGGEVLSQPHFAIALLTQLKMLGYRTTIETSGHGNKKQLLQMGQLCDEVLFDFKIMDSHKAKQHLGLNLERVLSNFTELVQQGCKVIPRLPLIPGFTLDIINLEQILRFLGQFDIQEIHLLPFHQYGANKYQNQGMEYQLKDLRVPSPSEIQGIRQHIEASDYRLAVGG